MQLLKDSFVRSSTAEVTTSRKGGMLAAHIETEEELREGRDLPTSDFVDEWICDTRKVPVRDSRKRSYLTCFGNVFVTDNLVRIPYQDPGKRKQYKFVCVCCKDCNLEYVGDTESEDWKDSNGQAKFSCQIKKEKEEKEAVSKRAHDSIHE